MPFGLQKGPRNFQNIMENMPWKITCLTIHKELHPISRPWNKKCFKNTKPLCLGYTGARSQSWQLWSYLQILAPNNKKTQSQFENCVQYMSNTKGKANVKGQLAWLTASRTKSNMHLPNKLQYIVNYFVLVNILMLFFTV